LVVKQAKNAFFGLGHQPKLISKYGGTSRLLKFQKQSAAGLIALIDREYGLWDEQLKK
jgi:hypothetical protein